jgi:signal transduction histidine kinase
MDRWRERVRSERQYAASCLPLGDADLDNHLPSLIDKLTDALRVQATPEVELEGAAHGHQRRTLGYTVPELLWEFRLFRQVLMEALRAYYVAHGEGVPEHEIEAARECILDVIDRSMTSSAQRYTADTEEERNTVAQALYDRTRQLEERTAALEEADHQKNRFLAMLSHELRNPIAPIVTAAHLLKQAHLEPRFERARDIIEPHHTRKGRPSQAFYGLHRCRTPSGGVMRWRCRGKTNHP